MVEVHPALCPIFLTKVDNFNLIRQPILDAIDSVGKYSLIDNKRNNLTNTDWHLSPNHKRPYVDCFMHEIEKSLKRVLDKFDGSEYNIINYWFQQYYPNDYFSCHNHGESNYSSVFYVELPEKTVATKFYDYNGKEFSIDVEEGDYLVFPSALKHEAPVNKTNKRKTIISLNLNILE